MGVNKVSTKNADYVLEFGLHSKESAALNADAYVLEGNADLFLNSKNYVWESKWIKKIVKKAKKENKPIFFVNDFMPDNKKEEIHYQIQLARSLLGGFFLTTLSDKLLPVSHTLKAGFGIFLVAPNFSVFGAFMATSKKGRLGKFGQFMRKTTAVLNILGISSFSLRSAFIAEQSEAIGELLSKQLKRKPVIQITAGAGHQDIKEYLIRQKLRRFYLKYFPFKNSVVANMETREASMITFKNGKHTIEPIFLKKQDRVKAKKPKKKWRIPRFKRKP